MNSKRSYLSSLNDGRQRKPSSALDDITLTLNRLESHLGRAFDTRSNEDEVERRIKRLADMAAKEEASPVRVSEHGINEDRSSLDRMAREIEASRRQDDQLASVGSLARDLRTLRGDMRGMINNGMREEFASLRSELNHVLATLPHSSGSAGLEAGLARISRSIAELSERDDRDTRSLQLELEQVKHAITDLVHGEQSRAPDARWGSDYIDPAFSSLQARLDDVVASIDRLPDSLSIRSLEERVRLLAHALEQLAVHSTSHQPELFGLIDERLDEISRAIAASTALTRATGIDPLVLERVEARITALAQQITELTEDQPSSTVVNHLIELSNRVDDIAERIEIPERTLERLTHYVAQISERLDAVAMPPEAEQMFHGIKLHLSQLSDAFARHHTDVLHQGQHLFRGLELRLEEATNRLGNTDTGVADASLLALIDNRFSDLARRIDDVRDVEDDRALHALELRLEDMANKLYSVAGNNADPRLLRKLETQLGHLSTLLSEPGHGGEGLAHLGPRLEHIERSITESRTSLVDATRQAAEEALQKFFASQKSSSMDRGLQDELQKLEILTRQSAERNSKTFEAVHDTLLKIVSRLGTLEAEGRDTVAEAPSILSPFGNVGLGRIEPAELTLSHAISDPAEKAPKSRLRSFSDALSYRSYRKQAHEPSATPSPEPEPDVVPDLNAILRRVSRDRGTPSEMQNDTAKADFIAAARRAAITSDGLRNSDYPSEPAKPHRKLGIGGILARHKKQVLMAIGGAILLVGGLQLSPSFSHRTAPEHINALTEMPTAAEPAHIATPSTTQAPAKLSERATESDPIQTGAIVAPPAMKQRFAEERIIPQNTFVLPNSSNTQPTPATVEKFIPVAAELPVEISNPALRDAALSGDGAAFFEIGNRLAEGRDGPADLARAAFWYEHAAEQGVALAQYRIGNMYEKGLGVERNIASAKEWYGTAAKQGNVNAMHNLGVLLAMGADNEADNKAAVRWFTEAADLDVTDSQFNLAILAAKGLGLTKDMTEAYKWLDIVARKGDSDAAAKRDEVAQGLNPEQLKLARGKAALWKARTPNLEANQAIVPAEWSESPVLSGSLDLKKAVANIQLILNKIGFDAGAADGIMGDKTRTAIKAFQAQNGMTPTGEIDDELVQKLLARNETA